MSKASTTTRTPAPRDVYEVAIGKGRPTLLEVGSKEELKKLLQTELELDDVIAQSVAHLAASEGDIRLANYRVTRLGSMVFVPAKAPAPQKVEKVVPKSKVAVTEQTVPAPHEFQQESPAAVVASTPEGSRQEEELQADSLFS